MSLGLRAAGLGLALGAIVAASCTRDFSEFQFRQEGGAGPTGPSSSTTPATTVGTGGMMGGCKKPEDCGVDSKCKKPTCNMDGQCGFDTLQLGAACTDDMKPKAKVCDGAGKCIECNTSADCKMDELCHAMSKTCIPATCMDKVQNQGETDLDCGGPKCPETCVNDKKCLVAKDCVSKYCQAQGGMGGMGGAGGMGGSPPMMGGLCKPCANDAECKTGGAYYCDTVSMKCVDQIADGMACTKNGECKSGFCTDKVCCDKKCDEKCAGCTKMLTGGTDGKCEAIPAGKDPEMECNLSAQTSCGDKDNCSGKIGSCELWDAMTECVAASCSTQNNQQTAQTKCDGMGKCPSATTKKCDPYTCGATACKTECTSEADCINTTFCDGNKKCETCGVTQNAMGDEVNDPACKPGGVCTSCPAQGVCVIDCAGNNCMGTTLNCPAGFKCTVNCKSAAVCTNVTINCPDKHSCTLNCQMSEACKGATVKATGTGTVKISCDNTQDNCLNAKVDCGVNKCEAVCQGASKPTLNNCGTMATNSCGCTPCN